MSLRWKTYLVIGVLVILVVLIAGFYYELITNTANMETPLWAQKMIETAGGLEPGLTDHGSPDNLYLLYPYPPPRVYSGSGLDPMPFIPDHSPFN